MQRERVRDGLFHFKNIVSEKRMSDSEIIYFFKTKFTEISNIVLFISILCDLPEVPFYM